MHGLRKEELREGKGETKDGSVRGSLKSRQRSQPLGGAAAADKVRREEKMNICAPLLSLLKGMTDLVALAYEILSIKNLGGSCSTRR